MSLRVAANCSMLFTERPLSARPAAARAAGFTGVEFWWPFDRPVPSDREVDDFTACIEDAGVALVAMNLFGGDLAAGERGVLSVPGREREFRDSLDVAVAIAGRLRVEVCNALYGNRLPGADPEAQDALALQHYRLAVDALRTAGTTAVIEPLSGVDSYPIRTFAGALAVADRVDGLRVLADLYHLAVNGDDLSAVVAGWAPRIGHVQLADVPGRHEPGTGTLPFERLVADLETAGYSGWVALEYAPLGRTEDGLGRVALLADRARAATS